MANQRWSEYRVYHIPVAEILGYERCNTDMWKHGVRLGNKEIAFDEMNEQRCYPKNHVWAGQHEKSVFRSDFVYREFFGEYMRVGCGHESSSGTANVYFGELISDFLYQLPYAEETESCSNPMNMWVRVTVEPKNVVKFERALNKMLDTIARIELFELPDEEE